jgi:uncharacterized protein (TIGR00369 family)
LHDPTPSIARERTVRWDDPATAREAAKSRSGLEVLTEVVNGNLPLPPISHLVGMRFAEVEKGRVVMTLEPHEVHYNPLGSVHGGIIATILDSVVGCAVHSVLPRGVGYTTLSLSINYLRVVTTETGVVTAEGIVEHQGRSTALARGTLRDAAGRLLATAHSTCMLFGSAAANETKG